MPSQITLDKVSAEKYPLEANVEHGDKIMKVVLRRIIGNRVRITLASTTICDDCGTPHDMKNARFKRCHCGGYVNA